MINKQVIAKTNGLSLRDHLLEVKKTLVEILHQRELLVDKFTKFAKEKDIFRISLDAVDHHDDGKSLKEWQEAAAKENGLLEYERRHEIDSVLLNNIEEPVTEFSILSHHGKMVFGHCEEAFSYQNAIPTLSKFYKINKEIKERELKTIVRSNFVFNCGRYFLQIADKTSSAKSSGSKIKRKVFDWEFPFEDLNELQKRVMNQDLVDVLFIKSSTGSGKTASSMLYAKRMVEAGKVDRVIFAMPSMFTSNSLYETIEASSIYHSNSGNIQKGKRDSIDFFYDKIFEWPITITTIDYILHVISQKTENAHLAMTNISNSIIIIDEADFYDDFVFANLKVAMTILKDLGVKFVIMSATFPESYYNFFEQIGYDSYGKLENTYSNVKKYRFNDLVELDVTKIKYSDPNFLLDKAKSKKTVIYANTIRNSHCYYNYFKKSGCKVLLYNSNYTQKDRIKKEKQILENFGKNATKDDYQILIMTQIGEMSINITCDYMITEICPIDRLVQRIGRLGRFEDVQKAFDVIIPIEYNKKAERMTVYAHPYTNYVEETFTFYPNIHLSRTIRLLERCKGSGYSMQDMLDMVENIYYDGMRFSPESLQNSELFEDMFKENWLFLPTYSSKEEEDLNTSWKTRNFYETDWLFVKSPPKNATTHQFRKIKSTHTIQLSTNKIRKGISLEIFTVVEIFVGEAIKQIVILSDDTKYNLENGLTSELY